jgi:hypothetical protein
LIAGEIMCTAPKLIRNQFEMRLHSDRDRLAIGVSFIFILVHGARAEAARHPTPARPARRVDWIAAQPFAAMKMDRPKPVR